MNKLDLLPIVVNVLRLWIFSQILFKMKSNGTTLTIMIMITRMMLMLMMVHDEGKFRFPQLIILPGITASELLKL